MTNNELKISDAIAVEAKADGGAMPSKKAIEVAAQIWCEPCTETNSFDPEVAMVVARKIDEYIQALQWCGGSLDFSQGGKARVGWERMANRLLRVQTGEIA